MNLTVQYSGGGMNVNSTLKSMLSREFCQTNFGNVALLLLLLLLSLL